MRLSGYMACRVATADASQHPRVIDPKFPIVNRFLSGWNDPSTSIGGSVHVWFDRLESMGPTDKAG